MVFRSTPNGCSCRFPMVSGQVFPMVPPWFPLMAHRGQGRVRFSYDTIFRPVPQGIFHRPPPNFDPFFWQKRERRDCPRRSLFITAFSVCVLSIVYSLYLCVLSIVFSLYLYVCGAYACRTLTGPPEPVPPTARPSGRPHREACPPRTDRPPVPPSRGPG